MVEKEGPCELSQLLLRSWIQDDMRRLGLTTGPFLPPGGPLAGPLGAQRATFYRALTAQENPGMLQAASAARRAWLGGRGGASAEEGT